MYPNTPRPDPQTQELRPYEEPLSYHPLPYRQDHEGEIIRLIARSRTVTTEMVQPPQRFVRCRKYVRRLRYRLYLLLEG